jgi:adhesin transport system membrane fusion protein
MLNISEKNIDSEFEMKDYESHKLVIRNRWNKLFIRMIGILLLIFILISFLPWTQNIYSKGYVTTLYPDQRPQTINTILDGKIQKWYVKEGDFVKRGDTILFISEIKSEYFDPNLLDRTAEQIDTKSKTIDSYQGKIQTLSNQMKVFDKNRLLKLNQAKNKLKQANFKYTSDSVDLKATEIQNEILEKQLERTEELYKQGLKSLTDLEQKKLKVQESFAKLISQENKVLSTKNEILNANIELSTIENDYKEKNNKLTSEQFSAITDQLNASGSLAKLQNEYSNYAIRQGLYFIKAPLDGFVSKMIRTGLGETIKAGESIVSIMPYVYDVAVEMYIRPIDYPLIKLNGNVRIQFDGWPTIFFRGWPYASFGTFGGKIIAIDNYISENGTYRILAIPANDDKPWPKGIRVGSGAKSFALLNDVPIWYEMWRNINGFPPEYYNSKEQSISPNTIKK